MCTKKKNQICLKWLSLKSHLKWKHICLCFKFYSGLLNTFPQLNFMKPFCPMRAQTLKVHTESGNNYFIRRTNNLNRSYVRYTDCGWTWTHAPTAKSISPQISSDIISCVQSCLPSRQVLHNCWRCPKQCPNCPSCHAGKTESGAPKVISQAQAF